METDKTTEGGDGRAQTLRTEEEWGGEDAATTTYPWLKCITGCSVKEDAEIIILECLHSICSDKCLAKLLSDVKPGQPYICRICNTEIGRERLAMKKIVPLKEFAKKSAIKEPTLICDNCFTGDQAVCRCVNCPALLCGRCEELHPQFKPTHQHVITKDMAEQKTQAAKAEEAAAKCEVHETELLTHVCINCQLRICEKCVEQHTLHTVVDSKKEVELLTTSLEMTMFVEDRSSLAVDEIKKKREELSSSGLDNMMSDVEDQFAMMMDILTKRHKEAQQEARVKYQRRLEILRTKACNAESMTTRAEEYVKVVKIVISDMDDISKSNFIRHSQIYRKSIEKMENTLRTEFGRFVEKDYNFEVDAAASTHARNYLRRFCQMEYRNNQPHQPKVAPEIFTGAGTVQAIEQHAHASQNSQTPLRRLELPQRKFKTDSEESGNDSRDQSKNSSELPKSMAEPMPKPDNKEFYIRKSKASTETICSPSTSSQAYGRGLGKRELDVKALPLGLVGTEEELRQFQTRESTEAEAVSVAATTRLARKSTSSEPKSSNSGMPMLQPEIQDDDAKANIKQVPADQSIGNDEETMDLFQHDPVTPRRSSRIRKLPIKFDKQKQDTIKEPSSEDESTDRHVKGKLRKREQSGQW